MHHQIQVFANECCCYLYCLISNKECEFIRAAERAGFEMPSGLSLTAGDWRESEVCDLGHIRVDADETVEFCGNVKDFDRNLSILNERLTKFHRSIVVQAEFAERSIPVDGELIA